ncbi:hypothetical protein SASPL_104779 [Salvia splendens]|uniref:Uncharacterized protein n=1 Tax=Salvia splendens TaxID=180675 RepID=A0A8X8YNB7_SALSN|nr:hypothetical protein SASPL_104779 [Salvia splendens]
MCGERGVLVEWCDQLRVLSHPSVGGSCRTTSDAKAIVEDWKVGWRFLDREFDDTNLKKRDEIAGIVKRFMDLESAQRQELTRKATKLRKICEAEFANGGSHQTNLAHLLESIYLDPPQA